MDFMASITREISPPDATFARGFKSSETLVEIRNSTSSAPSGLNSFGSTEMLNLALGSSSFSSFSSINTDKTFE